MNTEKQNIEGEKIVVPVSKKTISLLNFPNLLMAKLFSLRKSDKDSMELLKNVLVQYKEMTLSFSIFGINYSYTEFSILEKNIIAHFSTL